MRDTCLDSCSQQAKDDTNSKHWSQSRLCSKLVDQLIHETRLPYFCTIDGQKSWESERGIQETDRIEKVILWSSWWKTSQDCYIKQETCWVEKVIAGGIEVRGAEIPRRDEKTRGGEKVVVNMI